MSGKYNQLKKLASHFPVPALTAVTEHDLALWWENHREMRNAIERILTTINLTSSAFLDEHLDELATVLRPQWRADAPELLVAKLTEAGLDIEEALAVRSSGSVEDAQDHSYAGLFLTRLNVKGGEAVQKAIEEVWSSNFGRAVLIERLRCGPLSGLGDMTVILQRMVPAAWAGVAFSHDPVSGEPVCVVEAVAGYGEALVSGESRGVQAKIEDGQVKPAASAELTALLLKVASLVEGVVAAQDGDPTDVEWAYDGKQLWLLQARRITTIGSVRDADTPVCCVIPLYAATDAEIESFRPLPDFAQYFRSKRKPMADFAAHIGLPAATSLLIRANRAGLNEAEATALMAHFRQSQQLLDLSAHIRQQALTREQVIPRLRELLGVAPSVFVLRDFISGEGGLITQAIPEADGSGRVLCEWSLQGLLAINRGTASTVTFMIDAEGRIETGADPKTIPPMDPEQRALLYKATLQAQVEFGSVQLEWAYDRDQLYIIDYSRLDSISTPSDSDGTRIISAGYASGFPVVVDASRDIEQLSIAASVSMTNIPTPQALGTLITQLYERIRAYGGPVIVVSPKPYAALAPLVPYASGFLFEQASTLCHLAILLREQSVPAIESPSLYQQALASDARLLTLHASTTSLS